MLSSEEAWARQHLPLRHNQHLPGQACFRHYATAVLHFHAEYSITSVILHPHCGFSVCSKALTFVGRVSTSGHLRYSIKSGQEGMGIEAHVRKGPNTSCQRATPVPFPVYSFLLSDSSVSGGLTRVPDMNVEPGELGENSRTSLRIK